MLRRVCLGVVILLAVLSSANPASAQDVSFSCEVLVVSDSITVEWTGTPPDTTRIVVERRAYTEWHWRGRVEVGSAAISSFIDRPLPSFAILPRYRGTAQMANGQTTTTGCAIASSPGLSCELERTSDGFEIRFDLERIAPLQSFVRVFRRVEANGTLWQRTASAQNGVYTDSGSPTGFAEYVVVLDTNTTAPLAAGACGENDAPQCDPLERISTDGFRGTVLRGSDGRIFFTDRANGDLNAYDPASGQTEALRYEGVAVRPAVHGIGPEGNIYFSSSAVPSPGSPLFFYDPIQDRVRRTDLRPAGLWGLSEVAIGPNGLVYLVGRLGSQNNVTGIAAYDPTTNSAVQIVEALDTSFVSLVPLAGDELIIGTISDNEHQTYLYNAARNSVSELDRGRALATGNPVVAPDGRAFLNGDVVYEPNSGLLTEVTGPVPIGSTAIFADVRGERVLDFGGRNQVIEIWDVASDSFSVFDPSPGFDVPRSFVEASSGLIYFGNYVTDARYRGLWSFDPSTNVGQRVLEIGVDEGLGLVELSATEGNDGRIYFGFRDDSSGDQSQLWAYDPSACAPGSS